MKKIILLVMLFCANYVFAQDTTTTFVVINMSSNSGPANTATAPRAPQSYFHIMDMYGVRMGYDSAHMAKRKKDIIYLNKVSPLVDKMNLWAEVYYATGKNCESIMLTDKEMKIVGNYIKRQEQGEFDDDLVADYIHHLPISLPMKRPHLDPRSNRMMGIPSSGSSGRSYGPSRGRQ